MLMRPVLGINKDIPVTYTPAGKYKDQLKQTFLDVLRYKPAQGMKILKQVKDHAAVK